jgi:hypothetical protein
MKRKSATLGTHERIFMGFYIDEMHHNLSIYSRVPEVAESNENLHEDKKLWHRARLPFDKYLLKQEIFQTSQRNMTHIFFTSSTRIRNKFCIQQSSLKL